MLPLITALIPTIGNVLDKILPDPKAAAQAKLKLAELAQTGALAQLEADTQLAIGQLEINKADAASGNMWRGGWRPSVGWVCSFALAYTYLVKPLLPWIATVAGLDVPALPHVETTELLPLLFALLGLGTMRSYERVKGVIPAGK